MTLEHPTANECVAGDCAVVANAYVRPLACAAEGVVEVYEQPRFSGGVVGEPQHARTCGRCGLAVYVGVGEAQAVVVGCSLFVVVTVARTVAFVGFLVGRRIELELTVSGYEEEVAEVGNTGAAEVCEAED